MRLKLLALAAFVGATALPAAAQSYSQNCRESRGNNQAAGLVLGGILGGVLGSNVAASGHRHDGTALGAVLGGVVGSEIGRQSTNCDPTYYGPNSSYSSAPYYQGYPQNYGSDYPSDYSRTPEPNYYPQPDYGYYPDPGYANDYRYGDDYGYRDERSRNKRGKAVYGKGNYSYRDNDDYAGRDCDRAVQITRLPDGTEIRRPVEACRNAYYGDWKVRD
jgi:hypothetical protein